MKFLEDRDFRDLEQFLDGQKFGRELFSGHIWKITMVLVAAAVLVGGGVAGVAFLSHAYTYRGNTEVQHLLFVPFDHIPNDGGPQLSITFLNGTTSGFNFSVLNLFRGSIDYRVLFNLMMFDAVIQSAQGTLVQYRVDPANGHLIDNTTTHITWNVGPTGPGTASGNTSVFTAVDLVNDAGEQFFRADITVTFTITAPMLDGIYAMDVGLIAP